MHVVLFGASGTIGQRIAREARARGHQVTAVVRRPANVERLEGVSVVQGDVTDPASVARVVRDADAVVSAVSPRGGQPWRAGG
jgi:putative NADH-flavin reductase